MNETIIDNSEKIATLNQSIEQLLRQYRSKHDELELAVEEWDIGEIQESLAFYTKEINLLKKQVHILKENN